MAKGLCPECDELVGITDSGKRQNPSHGSSQWWRVDVHRDRRLAEPKLCDGSGALV